MVVIKPMHCCFTESANSGENIYAMMKTSMPAGMPAVCYSVS